MAHCPHCLHPEAPGRSPAPGAQGKYRLLLAQQLVTAALLLAFVKY